MKRTSLIRRTPLPRGKALARAGRIKRKPKSASSFAREYGSRARVKFVEKLPCAACGDTNPPRRENAHTRTGGTSRKADYTTIIPLCSRCHGRQHGPNGGWLSIGMTAESRARAAANTEALWLAHQTRGDDDATF